MELNNESNEFKNRITPKKPRLTSRQRKFLRTMWDEVLTPGELLKKSGMSGWEYQGWLRRKSFRDELALTMQAMGKRSDVDLAVGAQVGSDTLTYQAKYNADPNIRRLASVNLIGLYIARRRAGRGRKKRKASETPAAAGPEMQELPPDLPLAEAERLFGILERESPPPPLPPESKP